jgi:hypothetical protein
MHGHCIVNVHCLEVNIIAQAFVGFCAKVLSWAHDLSRRKREVLATTVLERARSGMDLGCSGNAWEIHGGSWWIFQAEMQLNDVVRISFAR